jgi:phospholipase/lecithinase/hemolysin
MFVFGDSYTATGFQVNGTQPNPSNPLGNPAFPGRTTSNGRNWIDFLTYSYNDSSLSVYNLAVSGAIVDDYEGGNLNTVFSQVNRFFLPFYSQNDTSKATWTSENTLFASFIGINDINTSYKLRNSTFNEETVSSYTRIVEQLYQAGARNFLFLNVPAIHRAPLTVSQNDSSDMVELNREAVIDLNSLISDMAQEVLHDHKDATVFLLDTFTLYNDVLDDPTSRSETSGYTNTTSFCRNYARFP